MPVQDFIDQPDDETIRVALEPAHHAIHSLLLVAEAESYSGLGEWVARTASALAPRERRRNRLVIVGLYHAVMPGESWSSFPAYVDHLATRNPNQLRDRMLEAYARIPPKAEESERVCADEVPVVDLDGVLGDVDSYLDFLRERFDDDRLDLELEAQAYSFVVDPPAMQDLIVAHLRKMWDEHLAAEWERVAPMLEESVRAFQQVDLGRMERREAVQWVSGQELEGAKWDRVFERAERIILAPSAHVGPYIGKFWESGTFWVLFGARLPAGSQVHAPDLSRAEIVMRLGALADDNRLRILQAVSEEGELSSQQIMADLGLSQSATSRHLKQLSATGYLSARRCNGAKCYRLDPERLEDTLQAVGSFLLGRS
ncbi:MAG: metalloregulator ArsR/SmtB family transcription factor [Anaerolineae bacterium]|jgi:DNA-binding transcriptional ArsR family regulator